MFKQEYIYELAEGKLTDNGYCHFINCVGVFARKYNWPRFIILSDSAQKSQFWTNEEVIELTHQLFEWIIVKNKLLYVNKIPVNYLSYYFQQVLISFISDKISEHQQKQGISFEQVSIILKAILPENYFQKSFKSKIFWYHLQFEEKDIQPFHLVIHLIDRMPKYKISEKDKQLRPLIKMAVQDIFEVTKSPMEFNTICKTIFELFDQSSFLLPASDSHEIMEDDNIAFQKHLNALNLLTSNLPLQDVQIIRDYLFNDQQNLSLSYLAKKYSVPKSTLHFKIESFRKKLINLYQPENEDDGIFFLKLLSEKLDELLK